MLKIILLMRIADIADNQSEFNFIKNRGLGFDMVALQIPRQVYYHLLIPLDIYIWVVDTYQLRGTSSRNIVPAQNFHFLFFFF